MSDSDNYSEKETAVRMEKALRKSLSMPPAPFTPKKKKQKGKPKKARARAKTST